MKKILSMCIALYCFFSAITIASAGELTFTYNPVPNDPNLIPWTQQEIAQLQSTISTIYPLAKTIYGDPFASATINIVKGGSGGGGYSSFSHQLQLDSAYNISTLTHELLHAFHDYGSSSKFEEGFVTAATEVVLNVYLAPNYGFGLRQYPERYTYYDLYNHPDRLISSNCYAPWTSHLLLYSLPAAVFDKLALANLDFYKQVNSRFYQKISPGETIESYTQKLQASIFEEVNQMENIPINQWWKKHYGYGFTTAIFWQEYQAKLAYKKEALLVFLNTIFPDECTPQVVDITFSDAQNTILGTFKSTLSTYFQVSFASFAFLQNYTGRLHISAKLENGENETYMAVYHDPENYFHPQGLIGLVLPLREGILTYSTTSLSGTTPIHQGQFAIPDLADYIGNVELKVKNTAGTEIYHTVIFKPYTREYFVLLQMEPRDITQDGLVDGKDYKRLIRNYSEPLVSIFDLFSDEKINLFDIAKLSLY